MKNPVFLIWLDSMDWPFAQKMLAEGKLPHLEKMIAAGSLNELKSVEHSLAETTQHIMLTGCRSEQTGYWSQVHYDPENYRCELKGGYDFQEFPPFYALGENFKVCLFDFPQAAMQADVHGIQINNWGCNSPMIEPGSSPPELYQEIVEKYGVHEGAQNFNSTGNVENNEKQQRFHAAIIDGIQKRTQVMKDLITRDEWDLCLMNISEYHMATHYFWEHPHSQNSETQARVESVYRACDQLLGEVLEVMPEGATTFAVSIEGMKENNADVAGGFILPELLYRMNFPGKTAREFPQDDSSLSEEERRVTRSLLEGWKRPSFLARVLRKLLPIEYAVDLEQLLGIDFTVINREHDPDLSYQATVRYRPVWKRMKAFALPTFSDAFIRINVKGREKHGIVVPEDYERVCDEVIDELMSLKDKVTGSSVVERVIRTREDISELNDTRKHMADLIVIWKDPSHTMISPQYGQMGPFRCLRTGTHHPGGFSVIYGPEIIPGMTLKEVRSVFDFFPTVIDASSAPVPAHLPGPSYLKEVQKEHPEPLHA